MRALKTQGATVLGAGAVGDGFESKVEALGIPFISLPIDIKSIRLERDVALFWTLYRWYRKEKPDVVHHFTIKPVIYGSIAARLARVPKIVNTVTGLGSAFREDAGWLRRVVEQLYRVALACAHCTFFQNPDDLEMFLVRRLVQPQKAGLLPGSGVDCAFFSPEIRRRQPSEKSLIFLMVARLLRDKGVYEFVEAARLVKRDFPATQFQMLGGRDERNPTVVPQWELDSWQQEGLVTWLGEVADVRPVVAAADVVVLPSYYREGIPRALLEAAAMEKPLITTDAVGCREVVDEGVNGLLVPVKDATVLADAMIRMLKDPAMRVRMGKAGRKKMERDFDERIVLEKILHTYTEGTL